MKSIFFLITVIFSCVRLYSVDLPVFYRAPLYYGGVKKTDYNWQSLLAVRYAAGDSHKSYNRHNKKGSLFGLFGKTDITRLGLGVENKGSRTAQLWQDPTQCNDVPLFNNLPLPDLCTQNDGLIEFCGKLKVEQLDVTLEQIFASGFYAQVHVPIRRVCVSNVGFKHCGNATVNGINIDDFVANDLPMVLQEAGYDVRPGQSLAAYGHFKKTEVPDLLVAAGWGGQTTDCGSIVSSLSGSMQVGITVPTGEKKDQNKLFAFPLGYDDHWGVNTHATMELGAFKMLVVGAGIGATIFFNDRRCVRMKTDHCQSGWFVFDCGKATVKKGTIWNVHGYARADGILGGLSITLGYSFTQEESTKLRVKDHCFLKSVVDHALACGTLVSRSYVASKDQRLKKWYQQVFHAMIEYDCTAHGLSYAPLIRGEVSIPFDSKRVFSAMMWGITAGISAGWNF